MAKYDLFSGQSRLYAAFRPTYPAELYSFILRHVRSTDTAWDCATGNGQVARALANEFKLVEATDISEKQLQYAHTEQNIRYSLQPAEHTDFAQETFDLITVAQALHWFNLDEFYVECKRVARPGCIIALWGYANVITCVEIHEVVRDFYYNVVGEFWEPARKHVEDHYQSLPFPFAEIPAPQFAIQQQWDLQHLLGYIESWSATQAYMAKTGLNPIQQLSSRLQPFTEPGKNIEVRFPVFLRLGRIEK